ncbi:MAG: amidase [Ruminococcus sp.]|nr:amidase [Ruminococcus sp.]
MLKADKTVNLNGVVVSEYLLSKHNVNKIDLPPMRTKPLIGVTIHNTEDLANVNDDAEQYTRATVNGRMNTVRTHFYADDLGAWQNLELERCNWTCTDGNGSGNMQTVSIECVMSGTSGADNLKARDNAARLAAYILHKYGLTANDLYTHTYWLHIRDGASGDIDTLCTKRHSYKTCPYYIIPDWAGFKKLVDGYVKQLGGKSIEQQAAVQTDTAASQDKSFKVRVIDPALNIRAAPSIKAPVVGVIRNKLIYTIIEQRQTGGINWGKLKSGAGWISLGEKYVKRV